MTTTAVPLALAAPRTAARAPGLRTGARRYDEAMDEAGHNRFICPTCGGDGREIMLRGALDVSAGQTITVRNIEACRTCSGEGFLAEPIA